MTKSIQQYFFSLALVVFTTFIFLSPSLENKFTNWDDDVYVLDNNLVVNKSVPIKEILIEPVSCNYHPLTMLSLALDYQFNGLEPSNYHFHNLLFHILNVCLVFIFIFQISEKKIITSTIAALIFGIHPMHVESVAWVSERKDVLYVFFFILGLITYIQFKKLNKKYWFVLTLILFVLSCLSKGMAVVFPIILLLVDYSLGVKLSKRTLIEKIPFILISVIVGAITLKFQLQGAISYNNIFSPVQTFVFATYGAVMYIFKFFFPINLCAYYPYPIFGKNSALPFLFYLMPFIVITIALVTFLYFRKEKAIVFGLLFYLLSVVLVLQFISVGTVIMADRYSYLSYLGLAYPSAYYLEIIWNKSKTSSTLKLILLTSFLFLILILGKTSYERTRIWLNSETLWTDVILKIKDSKEVDKAYLNRGKYYHSIGEDTKALQDFNSAIKVNPLYATAFNNRGNILRERGSFDSAYADFNRAIAINPNSYLFYSNRALVLGSLNRREMAFSDFEKSISINPKYWANYYNRGIFYLDERKYEKAIEDFNLGISLRYDYPDCYYRRGVAFHWTKHYDLAIKDFSQAILLNPKEAKFWIHKSITEKTIGNLSAAQADMETGEMLLTNN